MSGSPRQSPEEHDIYVAIPPPLVTPLARQLGSSQDSGSTHNNLLPTPISTNNSSASQSYAYWTMDHQYQRAAAAAAAASQDPSNGGDDDRYISGPGPEHLSFPPPGNSTSNTRSPSNTRPPNTPLSSPPGALQTQLLNRLYSLSSMVNPTTTDVAGGSSRITIGSETFIPPNLATGGGGSGGGGSESSTNDLQYPPIGQSPTVIRRGSPSPSPMTESTRNAAAAAIVDTLSRGESRPSRGHNPYIPSSLSMLFSDPEIMLDQEEVERAQLHQQQQQMRQRYMDSQRSFSVEHGVDSGQERGRLREEDDDDDVCLEGINAEDRSPLLLQSNQRDMRYGFEVVQQEDDDDEHQQRHDEVYHPYATVMSRNDYIAPHEPSSSSPLFPSPLTTLGRFTRIANPLEAQRTQVNRIWQHYGSTNNLQQQQQYRETTTPLSQSHAAYYHAVSNYHYSSQEDGGGGAGSGTGGSRSNVQPCTPANHVAVPGTWEWRRNRGRDVSQHSYGSAGAGPSAGGREESHGIRSWFRCRQEDRSEEHWLCGLLVSITSCWTCCGR
ncbi:hypothetical protein EDD21DRAFT_391980 [Dissophora ornata]|nr:hypothetical protein EDD21DRAFT_391980 [Dissophora ornata]